MAKVSLHSRVVLKRDNDYRNIDNTTIIDSGCSDHMCNNMKCFIAGSLRKTSVTIRMGDDTEVHVTEIGKTHIGFLEIEALFVPQFRVSLISVSKLAVVRHSMQTTFAGNSGSILDLNGRIVLKAHLNNGLYLASSGYESLPVPRVLFTTRAKAKSQTSPTLAPTPAHPLDKSHRLRPNKRVLIDSLHLRLWHM